jgi:hypothetical protein
LDQLQTVVSPIQQLIQEAVYRADAAGHDPTDALRGLIVTRDEVEAHLQQLAGDPSDLPPLQSLDLLILPDSRLGLLASAFGLTTLDLGILLIAMLPDLDRSYERIYAYLQDDVSLRYPTVNLIANLLGHGIPTRLAVWERLTATAPLLHHHLISLTIDSTRPNSTRLAQPLKVDHRIEDYLLGSEAFDERLRGLITTVHAQAEAPISPAQFERFAQALLTVPIVYLPGARDTGQLETAAALCAVHQLPLLSIDLERAQRHESPDVLLSLAVREGYLTRSALLFRHWDSVLDDQRQPPAAFWKELLGYPYPVFLWGSAHWEPGDAERDRRMLRLEIDTPAYGYRREVWLRKAQTVNATLTDDELATLANKFRFTYMQITRAVQTAADIAASRGEFPTRADVYAGAQIHASIQLGHLATRITPRKSWNDLILPPDQLTQLHEICDRMLYAQIVNEEWGFGSRASKGISALFSGDSGTGKTLAAEVIAHELGLPLYKIDLSAVVSKYIGETEKNLSAIFGEAQTGSAILFFDEADALFGKRSEVKDAHDRYANIEVAYLLQRIENYDGTVILASNFRHNLDDAFTRRLDFILEFPVPDADYRRRIFEVHFPPTAPLSPEVDLAQIAAKYRLSGGNIRNVTLTAAYLAAADGRVITPAHIRSAVRRENQKMGRLPED